MLKFAEKLWTKLASKLDSNIKQTNKPQQDKESFCFQIKPFKDNENWVSHRETLSKNLISLKANKITFVVKWNSNNIRLFAIVPKDFENFFKNIFYNSFQTSDLFANDLKRSPELTYIQYPKPEKIKSKENFVRDGSYMDPMNNIISIYNNISQNTELEIYITCKYKRVKHFWEKVWDFVKRARNGSKKKEWEVVEKKVEVEPELFFSIGYKILSQDKYEIDSIKSAIKSAFAPFSEDGSMKIKDKEVYMPATHSQFINFFHVPTKTNFSKWMEYTLYRKLAYPTNIPTEKNTSKKDLTTLWLTDYRWEKLEFWIKKEDKFRHMYIVGKTWTGKSTFIGNLIKSDMEAGNGLCLLDPHGELVDIVLEHIPNNRINDVILFDVADSEYPIGFNLLQAETEEEKNLVASGVVSTFYRLFGNSRGPRLEYILRNIVLSLVDYPNATLMHILRILTDKNFREEVISNIKDTVVLKFRQTEFNKWNDKQREEAVGPITNKVGQFLSSKLVRNIFGQPRTKLNLRKAMDEWKIILVNLSKGRIWEDNANMIWSLLVTKFQIDAMSRADVAFHLRRDFYLYIDEFQNFATSSFTTILSEARKYKLSLIVANQYTSQLLPEIRDAIFGNVWTIISFTLGHDDATVIAAQFKEMTWINDLISLPKFTAYTRLMIDGISSDPFSMKTLPLPSPEWSLELIDKIRKQSRQRYSMQKWQLERLMDAWNNRTFSMQEKIAERAKLESIWISSEEADNFQDNFIKEHLYYFTEFAIEGIEPNAIIFDTQNYWHKAVFYEKPKFLENQAILKFSKWQKVKLDATREITMHVDIYQHQTIEIENNGSLMIWIWSKENVLRQVEEIYAHSGIPKENQTFMKFCPNINQIWLETPTPTPVASTTPSPTVNNTTPNIQSSSDKSSVISKNLPSSSEWFSIKDIKLWERYEWYIKLSYNYGMFVTVKWVEWLLHKNLIVAPAGVERKKYYNIWDKIKVKATEFKEVNGEQKVVWSQK